MGNTVARCKDQDLIDKNASITYLNTYTKHLNILADLHKNHFKLKEDIDDNLHNIDSSILNTIFNRDSSGRLKKLTQKSEILFKNYSTEFNNIKESDKGRKRTLTGDYLYNTNKVYQNIFIIINRLIPCSGNQSLISKGITTNAVLGQLKFKKTQDAIIASGGGRKNKRKVGRPKKK